MTHPKDDPDRMADAALGEIDPLSESDDASYALAAAAIAAAHLDVDAKLPEHLSARVAADAEAFFSPAEARARSTTAAGAQVIVMPAAPSAPLRIDYARWGGWIAAAACVVIVVTQAIGLRASRSSGLDARATRHISLQSTDRDRPMESADLDWEESAQRGVLHTRGLAANAPGEEYEIWIADRAQGGESLVPIGHLFVPNRSEAGVIDSAVQSPILVKAPVRVVITVEPAGGVLVSPHPKVLLAGVFGSR